MENRLSLKEKTKAMAMAKWTMRKYLPFSIAYWILLFLSFIGVEIVLMTVLSTTEHNNEYVKVMQEAICYIPSTGFSFIAILYSAVISIMAFSYLHSKRSVDFFGSMPVGRRALFFSRYLAVVLLSIVPIIVFGTFGSLFSGSVEATIESAKILGILIVTILGNISCIAFISVCCGTVADVIVSYGVINIVYPVCVFICSVFPRQIIPGYYVEHINTTLFTLGCPVAAPFTAFFGSGLKLHVFWWIALSAALMAGCYFLCKLRKAETAQNAFAFSAVEIVIKFVTCFASGFGLGWLMAYIGEATNSVRAQYIWFVIGMVIGIMVVNILLHLIFHRGLSNYINSLKECGAVALTAITFLLVITTGALGFDTRIPDAEDVTEIELKTKLYEEFIIDGKDILMYSTDNEKVIEEAIKLQKQIVKNATKQKHQGLYPIISHDTYYSCEDYARDIYEESIDGIQMKYKLKDGGIIERKYCKFYGKVDVPDSFANLIEDNYSKLNAIPLKYLCGIDIYEGREEDEGMGYYLDRDDKKFHQDALRKIADALKKDGKEQTFSKKAEEYKDYIYLLTLEYEYNKNEYYPRYTSAHFYITEDCVNTLKALKETGYSNVILYSMLESNGEYESSDEISYTKSGKEIYFNVPESWNQNLEVRCMPYNQLTEKFLTSVEDNISRCEKISGSVYKYVMPEIEGHEFTRIMFYQYSKTEFNGTGVVPIAPGEENSLTTFNYKTPEMQSGIPWCEYEWTKEKKLH